MPPRSAADILHDLFCRFLHRPGFLSHLRSLKGYDEPEILPYSTRRNCLIGADAGHGERHPTDMAGLRGARLVTAVETEQGRRWAESKIKALTGGDKITARFMRQDFFEYTPA